MNAVVQLSTAHVRPTDGTQEPSGTAAKACPHPDDCLQVGEFAQIGVGQLAGIGLLSGGHQAQALQLRPYLGLHLRVL